MFDGDNAVLSPDGIEVSVTIYPSLNTLPRPFVKITHTKGRLRFITFLKRQDYSCTMIPRHRYRSVDLLLYMKLSNKTLGLASILLCEVFTFGMDLIREGLLYFTAD